MFQPQLTTPFAARSCASYGLAPDLDFGYSLSAGVGEAGTSVGLLYGSQPPPAHNSQPPPPPLPQQHGQRAPLRLRQLSTSSIATSSPFSPSSTSTASPPPHTPSSSGASSVSAVRQHPHHSHAQHQHQLQQRQPPPHAYRPSPRLVAPKMEENQGQHDIAAQQAAAKDFQIVHEVSRIQTTGALCDPLHKH